MNLAHSCGSLGFTPCGVCPRAFLRAGRCAGLDNTAELCVPLRHVIARGDGAAIPYKVYRAKVRFPELKAGLGFKTTTVNPKAYGDARILGYRGWCTSALGVGVKFTKMGKFEL